MTNYIIQPGYYLTDEDKAGLDRYLTLQEELTSVNGVLADEQAAMEVLHSVGRRTYSSTGNGVTVHSAIYNLTQRTVTWVANEHYGEADHTFVYSLK